MICFHKWSKWARPIDSYTNHKVQWRECTKCGKAQHQSLGYDQQCKIITINQSLEEVNPLCAGKTG